MKLDEFIENKNGALYCNNYIQKKFAIKKGLSNKYNSDKNEYSSHSNCDEIIDFSCLDLTLKEVKEIADDVKFYVEDDVKNKCKKKSPIQKFENIKQIKDCAKYYEDIFGLQNWAIRYEISDDLDSEKWVGQCCPNFQGRVANIIIRENNTGNNLFKCPQEKVLIHELLHCKFQLMDYENESKSLASIYLMEKQHQLLEDMAKSIFLARYDLPINYFIKEEKL